MHWKKRFQWICNANCHSNRFRKRQSKVRWAVCDLQAMNQAYSFSLLVSMPIGNRKASTGSLSGKHRAKEEFWVPLTDRSICEKWKVLKSAESRSGRRIIRLIPEHQKSEGSSQKIFLRSRDRSCAQLWSPKRLKRAARLFARKTYACLQNLKSLHSLLESAAKNNNQP